MIKGRLKNKSRLKQLGQGMTEYIIIVALIAIAAIAVYSLFGKTVKNQVSGMALELSGADGKTAQTAAKTAAESAAGKASGDKGGLGDYTGQNK
ncbi:hypothetical protein MNBD_GAMMA23-665 [hydrothermal vent metagenome]|uniref:Pilus assembly protein n=1 Tax=hydrothermal vent metagenome TaxID=652676 RepID=A0A3B0ZPP2_9ZZZZ